MTICTHQKECSFGEIVEGEIRFSAIGEIADRCWREIPAHFTHVELDEYVVMPNHVHGIIIIKEESNPPMESMVGTHGRASLHRKPRSLGALVAGFKSAATKRINEERNMPHTPVWQSRFYEHIIRSEKDLSNIRDYIVNNPMKWTEDEENPVRMMKTNHAHTHR